MAPLIGITSNYIFFSDTAGRFLVKGQNASYIGDDYIHSVRRAGGIPVILPMLDTVDEIRELIGRLDGLILTGGNDVDPMLYGEVARYECGGVQPFRDWSDMTMLRIAYEETTIPIMGVCRGNQVLNVFFGGDLYQDMKTQQPSFHRHFGDIYPRNYAWHGVTLEKDSKVCEAYGKTEMMVNSFHHQAVRKLGKGLKVTAVSDDGVIEGVELEGSRYVVGVQWHPEMMYDSAEHGKFFEHFVAACIK